MNGMTKAQTDLLRKLADAPFGTVSHYFLGFPNAALLSRLEAEGLIEQGDALSAKPVHITDAGRTALSAANSSGDRA